MVQRTYQRSFDHELRHKTCIALKPCNLIFWLKIWHKKSHQTQDLHRYVLVTLKITNVFKPQNIHFQQFCSNCTRTITHRVKVLKGRMRMTRCFYRTSKLESGLSFSYTSIDREVAKILKYLVVVIKRQFDIERRPGGSSIVNYRQRSWINE